ncbi:hypothetical protein BACFIN_05336 [Bacteroides finegoldii DSM 17565]|nr:hypothetical protein BACFIN_05336 [Bacteroides finegoldii DSM 17565]
MRNLTFVFLCIKKVLFDCLVVMFSVYDAVFKAKAGRCNVQTGYC